MYNWYQSAYDLLNNYIFGGTVVEGSYEDLMVCFSSYIICFLTVALPFVFVFAICKKLLFSWWS